jgi:hypothetical protein
LVLGESLQLEDPELSTSHVLGTIARTCEDSWQRLIKGSLNRLLVQFRDFVRVGSRLDLVNIKILIFDESAVTGIEGLNARQITLFLTRAQFIRPKTSVDPFWTGAFHSSQSPAFTNIRKYSRHRFVLMDWIREIVVPQFSFPDMRSSPNSRIVTFIRK